MQLLMQELHRHVSLRLVIQSQLCQLTDGLEDTNCCKIHWPMLQLTHWITKSQNEVTLSAPEVLSECVLWRQQIGGNSPTLTLTHLPGFSGVHDQDTVWNESKKSDSFPSQVPSWQKTCMSCGPKTVQVLWRSAQPQNQLRIAQETSKLASRCKQSL